MPLHHPTPLVAVRSRRFVPGRWDALAVVLIVGVIVVLARGSQGRARPR